MTDKLKLDFYFVSPLEVVKVSRSNLEQVAEWCGGKIATVESRRNPGRVDTYVWVPTPKGTQISWAFPGMFITKRMVVSEKNELKVTYSVFRRDYFERNYFESPNLAVDMTWERAAKEASKKNGVKVVNETNGNFVIVENTADAKALIAEAKERETPSSPLTEPREAEKHEEIAETLDEADTPLTFDEEIPLLVEEVKFSAAPARP